MNVPSAPIYHPTKSEFDDPLLYIQSIRSEAQQYGICKIIPPDGWRSPFAIDAKNLRFGTRKQRIDLLQCRDMDAAKVDFLTRLVVFWQGRRQHKMTEAWRASVSPTESVPSNSKNPMKRRSESQLLNDSRRRPTLPLSSPTQMDESEDYEASAGVLELKAYAASHAANRAGTPRDCTKQSGRVSSTPSERQAKRDEARASSKFALDQLALDDGEDLNNFTLDGVQLTDGEIVAPKIKRDEVDLFVLYELVAHRFGGFDHIMKKQWIDIVRLVRMTSHIIEVQQQFRSNSQGSPAGSPIKPESITIEEDSGAQLVIMAEEMRRIYRTYLLPYERHVVHHNQTSSAAANDIRVTGAGHDDDSDEEMKDANEPESSSSDRSHLAQPNGSDLPLPTFSMDEIKRWPIAAARKQKETAMENAAATSPTPQSHTTKQAKTGRMGVASSSPAKKKRVDDSLCAQCKVDSLSPTTQCYTCNAIYHWCCLSPPLLSPPFLPWYCSDCHSAGSFGFEEGEEYDLPTYEQRANEFKHSWFWKNAGGKYTNKKCPYHYTGRRDHSPSKVAKTGGECICKIPDAVLMQQYWSIVEHGDHAKPVTVEYGSDIDTSETGSGFPSTGLYARSGWNLNNLPTVSRSILKHLTNISGVTSPWMYIGMCFSTFCFHAEDHYTYSINYVHQGAPKQWYGIPSHAATAFETVARQTLPHLFAKQPDLMFQMVTMINPAVLQAKGVPVYSITQQPGEFVLTFPQAYHAGFNFGVNIAEAVNFGPADWLPFAIRSVERYRCFQRTPVFSTDLLLMSLAREQVIENDTAAWLLPCLKHARNEEFVMREHLRAMGLVQAHRWTHDLHLELFGSEHDGEEMMPLKYIRGKAKSRSASRKVAATDQCVHCKHAVHISAVWCSCKPNALACLRHAAHLCACGPTKQTLLMRYHMDEFDRFISRVERQLSNLTADTRVFHRMGHSYEDVVESVDDILAEAEQQLEDTEVPLFNTELDEDEREDDPTPSYSSSPVKAKFPKTDRGRQAFTQTQALHQNYTFLRQAAEEHAKVIDASNPLQFSASSALEVLRSCVYPIPVVLTPLTRHVITPPSSVTDASRKELDRRAEKWIRSVKPYVVESMKLKKANRKQARAIKRKQGIETDSSESDEDSDSDNDDDNFSRLEKFHFNGDTRDDGAVVAREADIEAEEEMLDRTLNRILSQKCYSDVAAARRSHGSASSTKVVRLSLSQLEELLKEGRELIWSPLRSRDVNLVFYKLSQWAQLVEKLRHLSSNENAASSWTEGKQELTTARRLIRASINAPIDFTRSSSKEDQSSWATRMSKHIKNLKSEVAETEKVESKLEKLFAVDLMNLSPGHREVHPVLLTRTELCELQEKVNGLPLSFPLSSRLTGVISRMSQWLRKSCLVLELPLPRQFTTEQVLRFSPHYRPWATDASGDDQPTTYNYDISPGDVDSAQTALLKLELLPLKDPIFALLAHELSSVQSLSDRARRLLFLSPSHGVARDHEAFMDPTAFKRAEEMKEKGPCLKLGDLLEVHRQLQQSKLKPRTVIKRVERLLKEIESWQADMRTCIQLSVEQSNQGTVDAQHGASKTGITASTSKLVEGLNSLHDDYRELGVTDLPERALFEQLQEVMTFQNEYRQFFIDALSQSYPSTYFNFKLFSPREWRDQLERVFSQSHPLKDPSWQQEWKNLISCYLNPPTTHVKHEKERDKGRDKVKEEHSPPLSATSSTTANLTPSKRRGEESNAQAPPKKSKVEVEVVDITKDDDVIMADAESSDIVNGKNKPMKSESSSSSSRMRDVDEASNSDSNSNSDDDAPAEIRRSGRVVIRKRYKSHGAESSEFEEEDGLQAAIFSTRPVVVKQTNSSTLTLDSSISKPSAPSPPRRKAHMKQIVDLLERGKQMLAKQQTAAASSSSSPPRSDHPAHETDFSYMLTAQVAHVEELCILIGRVHQYLAYLEQLKQACGDLANPNAPEGAKSAARIFLQLSSASTMTPGTTDCPYYSAPMQCCPFYNILHVEKLYVMCKSLESMYAISFQGSKLLKEVYTQAYLFQLVARRLRTAPHLSVTALMNSDPIGYEASLKQHSTEVARVYQAPSHDWSHVTDFKMLKWREITSRVEKEKQLELNVPLWIAILHAEYRVNQPLPNTFPPLQMIRTPSNIWVPAINMNSFMTHHSLLIHPLNHATYQDLAGKYAELIQWTALAKQLLSKLQSAILWMRDQRPPRPLLWPLCLVTPLAAVLHESDVRLQEARSLGFHSPLYRKLRQAAWTVRVYEALAEKKPLEDMVKLLATQEACRAVGDITTRQPPQETTVMPPQMIHQTTVPLPFFTHSLPTIPDSIALSIALAAVPENEFDAEPWVPDLVDCVQRGWRWMEEARRRISTLAKFESSLTSRNSDVDSTKMEPPMHYDDLYRFTSSACPCVSSPPSSSRVGYRCMDLKLLHDRLAASQVWASRIRSWVAQGETRQTTKPLHPLLLTPAQSAISLGAIPPTLLWPNGFPGAASIYRVGLGEDDSGDNRKLHVKHLPRLISAGKSVLIVTQELEMLQAFQRINTEWMEKLDALFQPRHAQLHLRYLLKSLVVPITGEQERDKLRALLAAKNVPDPTSPAKPRQPVPDSNDLYCICKRPYDDTLFMIACNHCNSWYHGDCVNVPIVTAQRLLSYLCPRCCMKSTDKSQQVYHFGNVNFRHARPTLVQCQALIAWLDDELLKACPAASELIVIQYARSFRHLLAHIDVFKSYIDPWLKAIIDEQSSVADPITPPPSPFFTDPAHLAHLKGCIRQGKKLGVNFPELPTLKKRYDQARTKMVAASQTNGGAPSGNTMQTQETVAAEATPANYPLSAAPAATASAAQSTPEVIEID